MISTIINNKQIAGLEADLGGLLSDVRFETSEVAQAIRNSAESLLTELRSLDDRAMSLLEKADFLRDVRLQVRFAKRKWMRLQTAEKRMLRRIGEGETHVATNAA